MQWQAPWIKPAWTTESKAPLFAKRFRVEKPLTSAVLRITGLGVYEACINARRVTRDVLTPGWTAYHMRLQVQSYDVTPLISVENEITVLLGKGWYRSPLQGWRDNNIQTEMMKRPAAITAVIAKMKAIPPIVGVPSFDLCQRGPISSIF